MNNMQKEITVAVAGQPNTGKSTVFNYVTGFSQRVGNWSGTTVDKKEARVMRGNRLYQFVDLPGCYGLSAHSLEEKIARDYLISLKPDVVIVVVNAASVERSLYLVSELITLKLPIIIALNMVDVAQQEGVSIDAEKLSAATGLPVVPMVASRRKGIAELLTHLDKLDFESSHKTSTPKMPSIVDEFVAIFNHAAPLPCPLEWTAFKLIEGDSTVIESIKKDLSNRWKDIEALLLKYPQAHMEIINARKEWIEAICDKAVKTMEKDKKSLTEKWDSILLHPLWGNLLAGLAIPLCIAIGVGFWMVTGGVILKSAFAFAPEIKAALPGMLGSFLSDAILMSAGWVLALAVLIVELFGIFLILEDVGYLSRVSFLADRMVRRFGIGGKSVIPLTLGLICNTGATIGTRIIESTRERLITVLMMPFIPCGAQTFVAATFLMAVFPMNTAIPILLVLTLSNIIVSLMVAKILSIYSSHPPSDSLIMELPLFHRPNARTILSGIRVRVWQFIKRAGTVIILAMIFVWALSYFPYGDIKTSYLYGLGHFLEPLGKLMGLDWRFMTALLGSFIAKENTAATLGVLFSVSAANHQGIIEAVRSAINPAGALAFVVVSNYFVPCIATAAGVRSEIGSWKKTIAFLVIMLSLAFLLAIVTYRIASVVI